MFSAILVLALARVSASAEMADFHYTREILVPGPGWIRVPLDLNALRHLAPGAPDLHVYAPTGGEVPLRVEAAAPRRERRPLAIGQPAQVDDGWELVLDAGARPVPHERLFLQVVRPPLAPPDRVESSQDGLAWRPLPAVEPLQIRGENTNWTGLSYPVTGDRYLRLHWPAGTEATRISAAEIEAITGPTLSITSRDAECEAGRPGATFCRLALPASGQIVRRLTLEIAGAGDIGHRLDVPHSGRWQNRGDGVWRRSGERTGHLIAGGTEPVADSVLRLALYGSPQDPPRLVTWSAELTVQTVLFRAMESGSFTLAYGGPPRAARLVERAPPAADAAWVEAGREVEHAPPPLPRAATAPGARLGTRRLDAAWQVIAPAAEAGVLVHLELPDAVYAAARFELGNLRLVQGERQIPFYRWSPAAPVLAASDRGLRPSKRGRRSRETEVTVHLPASGLPVTELDLWAPAGLLRRAVEVWYPESAGQPARRNGGREARRAAVRDLWLCRPQPPFPCHQRLLLPGPAPQSLSVRFHDGDNPPLGVLEVEVWRRRDVLLFVWPEAEEGAPVRLLAGPGTLRAPSYDLQALGDALLSYPWQPAELSLEEAAPAIEPWSSRWLRPLILALAAIGLLLLLRRILAEA